MTTNISSVSSFDTGAPVVPLSNTGACDSSGLPCVCIDFLACMKDTGFVAQFIPLLISADTGNLIDTGSDGLLKA